MPEFEFNTQQRIAKDTRGRGLLVAAAAGSGKTRVLTERLMQYVRDPESNAGLDRFLVITYTRAAAAELKSRITEALGKELKEHPENKHLLRQLALSRKTHIQTIHGFCADVIRQYGHSAGISPDFKILEEERAGVMKSSALAAVIEEHYANPERYPGFTELAESLYSNRKDDDLFDSVLTVYEKMQSHAFPMNWAQMQLDVLSAPKTDVAGTVWGREIIDRALVCAGYWRNLIKGYIDLLQNNENGVDRNNKIRNGYMSGLCEVFDVLDGIMLAAESKTDSWGKIKSSFKTKYDSRMNTPRKDYNVELAQEIKSAVDDAKDEIVKLKKLFSSESDVLIGEVEKTVTEVRALVELVEAFTRRYGEEKSRLGFLDYSDLEHVAVGLLVDSNGKPTDVASDISKHFSEILVDEYQDVSEVQNDIISSVSRGGTNLFMVGDVKQSIYSFRLADPRIFTDKCRKFTDISADGDTSALLPDMSATVFMNKNYRSRREIIDGVNAVFECCMSPSVGDVEYSGGEELCFAADYFEGEGFAPEFMLIDKGSHVDAGMRPSELEAETVAEKISALINEGTAPKDIAVLMRKRNKYADTLVSALRKRNIPVSAEGGNGFFESDEILALTSFLSLIDNPHKDVDILSILRYPVFGFTPDELAQLRISDKKGNLHAALKAYGETSPKAKSFVLHLDRLRALAPEMSVSDLVWTVMNETDFIPVSCAMPGGEARRTNLLQFAAMAEEFDSSGSEGLHKFLLWVKNRRSGKNDVSFGGMGGEGVRIMTIHKSKGLEFPIVFVVGMSDRFNSQDSKDPVVIHSELGFGVKLVDNERKAVYPTLCRNAIIDRMSKDRMSEELRILYVAMTRAKEKLYLTAIVNDAEKELEEYSKSLSRPGSAVNGRLNPYLAGKKESCLNWLLSAALLERMSGRRRLKLSVITAPGEDASGKAEEDITEPVSVKEPVSYRPELLEELDKRFSWEYPFGDSVVIPSKITATAVKDPFEARDELEPEESVPLPFARPADTYYFRAPALGGGEIPVGAAEAGTATHAVLQYINLEKTESAEQIEAEISRLVEKGCITARQADAVSRPMLLDFFASETGRRIVGSADRVKREFRFSVLTPPEQLGFPQCGDQVLLQGVADCCIVDPDGLVIIDYKTDRTKTEEELEERVRRYSTQLRVYAGALSRIFRLPVKECVLYFLRSGAERSVSLQTD